MIQRGRKSVSALAVVKDADLAQLPPPPARMSDEQGLIWRTVMASPIAQLIRPEAWPILEEYCRAVVNARRIGALIDSLDPETSTIDEWDKLLNMQARTQRAMQSLAEKLRIPPSTVHNGEKTAAKLISHAKSTERPWEDLS